MNELGSGARALIDAAASGDEPRPEDHARVRRGLAAAIGTGAALAATATATTAAAGATATGAATIAGSSAAGASLTVKALMWLAVGGVTGVAVSVPVAVVTNPAPYVPALEETGPVALASARTARAAVAERPKTLVAADTALPLPDPGEPVRRAIPAAGGSETLTAAPDPAAAAPTASAFAAELEQLAIAGRALGKGDPQRALDALDASVRPARAGAGSALVEERAATRAIALCDLGRAAEGSAAAADFLGRFPRSPLAPRVRAACSGR